MKKIKNKTLSVVNASGSLLHLKCMGSCSLCASGLDTLVLLNKLELETASSWPWALLCCRQAAGSEKEQPPTRGSLAESWEHQQPGSTHALGRVTCDSWWSLAFFPKCVFYSLGRLESQMFYPARNLSFVLVEFLHACAQRVHQSILKICIPLTRRN